MTRRLAITLIFATALVGCGDDDGDDSAAPTPAAPEKIVIKTEVTIPTGKVASGSTLDGKPFCPGGTIRDRESQDPAVGFIEKTITCPDGTLRIGFSPAEPQGGKQTGPWKIVGGTGAYEGLTGSGTMEASFDSEDSKKGRETFTGTAER
jgi:hypothetical protein